MYLSIENTVKFIISFISAEIELLDILIRKSDTQGSPLCFLTLQVVFLFLFLFFLMVGGVGGAGVVERE